MQSSVAQKQVTEKSNVSEATPAKEGKLDKLDELGTEAGMPVFLQRMPDSMASPGLDETDDELIESSVIVQPKLKIGESNDDFEKEADSVADAVVQRSQDNNATSETPSIHRVAPNLQLQSASYGGELNPEKSAHSSSSETVTGGLLTPPDIGSPLKDDIRSSIEPVLGADIRHVRVHDSCAAQQTAESLNAKAFTNRNHIWLGRGQSQSDKKLMSHEATHVVQQALHPANRPQIQRLVDNPAEASAEVENNAELQSGSEENGVPAMSTNEIEGRLTSTPADGAQSYGSDVELSDTTVNRLGSLEASTQAVEVETGEDSDDVASEAVSSEADKPGAAGGDETDSEAKSGKAEGGAAAAGGGAGGNAPPDSNAAPEVSPAANYENLVDNDVGAYLNGDLAPDRQTSLNETTTALLAATEALSNQQISEPESHGFLASVTGLGPLGDSLTRLPPGYENEPTWLQAVAVIRDVCASLGGVVGMVGLAATVSGLIMSLLVPPVGAFLLTAGRFCDVAALILDIIALVTGVILTGYNLYRLKTETDPDEKARLLALVRQDAMATVMSGLSVATAVAPGAAKALGRTGAGQAVSGVLRSAANFTGDLVGGTARRLAPSGSRLARAASTVGDMGSSVAGGARSLGRSAAGGVHRGAERLRRFGARVARRPRMQTLANSGPVRRIRNLASGMDDALTQSDSIFGRVHRESRQTADSIHMASMQHPAVRELHESQGRAMQARLRELTDPAINPNAANLTPEQLQRQIYEEFSMIDNPDAIFIRQRVSGGASGKLRRNINAAFDRADFDGLTPAQARQRILNTVDDSGAPKFSGIDSSDFDSDFQFGRNDKSVLDDIRAREADRVRAMQTQIDADMAGQPVAARDARIADELNGPLASAHWTPEEIAQFRAGNATTGSGGGMVTKTPHHSIRFADAPHLHHDSRLIQMGNAPAASSSYRQFTEAAATTRAGSSPTYLSTKPDIETAIANGDFPGVSNIDELADAVQAQRQGGLFDAGGGNHFLFDEHRLVGHGLNTAEEGARPILNNLPALRQTQNEALFGAGPDGLLGHRWGGAAGQATRQASRSTLPGSEGDSTAFLQSSSEVSDSAAASRFAQGTSNDLAAVDISSSMNLLSRLGTASSATVTAGAVSEGGSDSSSVGGNNAVESAEEIVAPPPSPAEYSPESLENISAARAAIGSAITVVTAYIGQTQESISINQSAREAAGGLKSRNQTRAGAAEGEQQDIVDQQSKLDQSKGAQENMKSEQSKASGEASKGESEGSAVKNQGDVEVEAKEEEPESRGWLERAWDATAGAAWNALVQPVIDAAKRKVAEVMEGINSFIMDMINQALGLDEIEAELTAGGEDIETKKGSLEESTAGMGEVKSGSEEDANSNQSTADQADANIGEAGQRGSEAEVLLEALIAHHEVLTQEEQIGKSYVSNFSGQNALFFEQQAALPAQSVHGDASVAGEETVGAAEVSTVTVFLSNFINAESNTIGELNAIAGQSAAAIDGSLANDEAAIRGTAMNEFTATSTARLSTANRLIAEAQTCQGMSVSQGMPKLEDIYQQAKQIADELEAARSGVIQAVASVHQQAISAAGEDENATEIVA